MSYPFLGDVVKDLTGYDIPLPLATFGLFVALGALVAGACFHAELHACTVQARSARHGFGEPRCRRNKWSATSWWW